MVRPRLKHAVEEETGSTICVGAHIGARGTRMKGSGSRLAWRASAAPHLLVADILGSRGLWVAKQARLELGLDIGALCAACQWASQPPLTGNPARLGVCALAGDPAVLRWLAGGRSRPRAA